MAPPLTPEQAAIIKSTVPVLAIYGETITKKFYADMLEANPSLNSVFNKTHQATGHQARALAGALYAYASHIDNLSALSPAIELICHKHASLGITAEQYGIVGRQLLQTMKTVLGEAATEDIMDAWAAAYWQLADVMIGQERALYEATRYWPGWQDFKIARKEKESSDVTSFYLVPSETAALRTLPRFKPGQYVSLNVFVDKVGDQGGEWQARQYSLSDGPGKEYLRISVKREPGVEIGEPKHMTNAGYLSNILHANKEVGDVVQVTHPFGDFFFDEEKDEGGPVVLMSAGVGLTCLMSILNALVEKGDSRPISWIHVARDSKTRAYKAHVDELAAKHDNLQAVYFSTAPGPGEIQGQDYHIKGRLDLDKVEAKLLHAQDSKTQYFVCGPTQFMLDTEAKLNQAYGVSSDRIKMELFGTGGVPRA